MKYETWMRSTELRLKPRSKYLTAIDKALLQFHTTKTKSDLDKLKLALHQWKLERGYSSGAGKPAWLTDERNRNRAVEQLDLQVFGYQGAIDTSALADLAELPFYGVESWVDDFRAKQAMKQAREDALCDLFQGKDMALKKASMAIAAELLKRKIATAKAEAAKTAQATSGAAKSAVRAALQPTIQQAEQIVIQLIESILGSFPPDVVREVMQYLSTLVPQFVFEVAHSILPYISCGVSGGMAIVSSGQAIYNEYKWIRATGHMDSFAGGDPYAAANSVRRIIERERNQAARLAGLYGADATVKASSIVMDAASLGIPTVSAVMTPLSGFARALAQVSLQIFLLGRDIYEKQQANKLLGQSTSLRLSASLFDACPVLGCYFVACSNTSNLINFIVEDIGSPGWQFDVEVLVQKHIQPMVGYARDAIDSSRLEVPGLAMSKGAVGDVNLALGNIKYPLQKRLLAKLAGVLPFVDQPAAQPLLAKAGMPTSSPVPAGRIQGIGPRA